MPSDYNQYQPYTGFFSKDTDTQNLQDLGQRYITKSYLMDVYPSIASATGARTSPGLWLWGENTYGQLGLGTSSGLNRFSPIQQINSAALWKQVAGTRDSNLGIKTDSTLWVWGANGSGQLGDGTTIAAYTPKQVGTASWSQVSCGWGVSAAIKTDGTLWTWGKNSYGQLGRGNVLNRSVPSQVGASTDWRQVACIGSGDSMFAIKADGSLWAWGRNQEGQLGLGNVISYSIPTQVGTSTDWKQVVPSAYSISTGNSVIAIKQDGTLWGWGNNNYGQLGDGSTSDHTRPVLADSATNWKQVAIGDNFSLGVKTDGTLWAWGVSSYGRLGLNSTTSYSIPTQVGTLTNWKQVKVTRNSSVAIKTDGTLWTWGNNAEGELGFGDYIAITPAAVSSPIQVGALTTWKSIACGWRHVMAIQNGNF